MTIGLGHYLAVGAILFTLGDLRHFYYNRKERPHPHDVDRADPLASTSNLVRVSTFLGDPGRPSLCAGGPDGGRPRRPPIRSADPRGLFPQTGRSRSEDINLMKG